MPRYLKAVLQGRWVVDVAWVRASIAAGYWVDEEPYEMAGDVTTAESNGGVGLGAPRHGRLRIE